MLSDVYFSLAVAHIYNSSPDNDPEPSGTAVDPVAEKQAALKYYNLSREVSILAIYKSVTHTWLVCIAYILTIQTLKLWLEKNKGTGAAEEIADTEELMDILTETTDALVQEIKEVDKTFNFHGLPMFLWHWHSFS